MITEDYSDSQSATTKCCLGALWGKKIMTTKQIAARPQYLGWGDRRQWQISVKGLSKGTGAPEVVARPAVTAIMVN